MNDNKPDLYLENQQYRRQLKDILGKARANEVKLNSLFKSVMRISRLNTLSDLINEFFNCYPWSLNDESRISLVLVHDKNEMKELLLSEGLDLSDVKGLRICQNEDLIIDTIDCKSVDKEGNYQFYHNKTFVGKFKQNKHGVLFPGVDSIAILPLIRHQELIGVFSISSDDPMRFHEGAATDFMDFYRDLLSIALENAILFSNQNRDIYIDQLTGLKNRRFFDIKLEEVISCPENKDITIYCMVLDVDKFKRVNDTYGHLIGDKVLKEFAAIIAREIDHKYCVARFGGEEFVVLLSSIEKNEVINIAERVRSSIESASIKVDDNLNLMATISIGISFLANSIANKEVVAKELFEQADKALYEAKNKGRNTVVFYNG